MLVARREPFELGAQDRGVPAPPAPVSSRFQRALHVLQMLGALVAVPAGLGSAYTVYKTNYSSEGTCQSLRANIIAMIDRNVDAGIRRALVRRDVETFETTCGAADPDATAAFKMLLAHDKARPATAPAQAERSVEPAAAKSETPVAKSDSTPAVKAEPAPAVKAESAPKVKQPPARIVASAEPETPVSDDTEWLAAVRGALANHPKQAPIPPAPPAAPGSLGTLRGETTPSVLPAAPPAPAFAAPTLPPPPSVAAPTLPPPPSVAATPAPQAERDRPVPPGAIPEAPAPDPAKRPSRIGEWVGDIPFFGKALADHMSR